MPEDVIRDLTREVSDLRGDIRALTARIDERLDSGGRRMDDYEGRLRVLEAARWRAAGAYALISLAVSGVVASLLVWALSRH